MAKNLGKGLEALIKSYSSDQKEQYLDNAIPIDSIVPNKNQPRQVFNDRDLNQLIDSIKKIGVLQPISIRKKSNTQYELIAGERRWRAAKKAGLQKIPAYIINISNDSEMMEYALIENIQRVDLNPIEEAEGYAVLSGKHNLTHALIAQCVSKSRSEVSNKLRLLNLPPVIKDNLKNSKIEYGHARALLGIRESTIMLKVFKQIISKKLNVRQTELLIKNLSTRKKVSLSSSFSKYTNVETDLQNYLDTKVMIKNSKNKVGKILIEFLNEKDLKKIINKIKNKFSS